ncbi:PucR family transcriptional regulator [Kineococcus rhizosphaerae]|uniref:Sugar diacid utilization regulator n=1 Tax=Kineococcus rhizosphaerae TaxID=559628 RepID=A0A2T0RAU5_9ACTN|nr:helix-turn-helix domain-containing protein [Kineococcus rhizosphaerae]PRY18296.1 sugar diacid utilization regulator [Kineococcus rhizosphaerae]
MTSTRQGWLGALHPALPPAQNPPASSPATVATARLVLGEAAVAWAVEAARAINDEVEAAARLDSRLPLTGLEPAACEAGLLTVLRLVRLGLDTPVSAPEEAVEQVRLAVRQGTPLDSVVRVIWASHSGVQDRLLAVVGEQVPPGDLIGEVRELTRTLQVFADLMARELSAVYEAERVLWHDRVSLARRQVVDEITSTGTAPRDAETVLGLALTDHHLAGRLWLVDAMPHEQAPGSFRSYAARLSAAAGARSTTLLDDVDGSTTVLWSFARRPAPDLARVLRAVDRPQRTALALGPLGCGAGGLQRSLLGAEQARAVAARRRTPDVCAYEDSAMLALLLHDEPAARRFALSVLDGLTGRDAKSAAVRRTLAAYLAHSRSRTAAAQELSLAANTVAYRVRQAEEALGRTAGERSLDTLVALRLVVEVPDLLPG